MKKQNLKAAATFMVLMLVTCLSTPSAHGTVTPKQEKIVAADGSGDYTTITAALNAINATAQAPYVIKVRPGNYPEALTMKSYVSLEGDGPGATTITASTSPTVNMADNSTIRNIKVQNTTSGPRIGLNFTGGTAAAENVVVELLNGTYGDLGVSLSGGSKVELRNITVNIIAGYSSSIFYGIYSVNTSQVAILNSNIYVDGNGGPAYPFAVASFGEGTISIRDSVLEATNSNSGVYTLECRSTTTTVTGSKILASKINPLGDPESSAIEGPCKIMSSEIRATNLDLTNHAVNYNLGGAQQIGGSLIQGSINNPSDGKRVNCWDENFNPIPNN